MKQVEYEAYSLIYTQPPILTPKVQKILFFFFFFPFSSFLFFKYFSAPYIFQKKKFEKEWEHETSWIWGLLRHVNGVFVASLKGKVKTTVMEDS